MKTFNDYLQEAFKIKPVKYGNNLEMNNGEFTDNRGFIYTFFELGDLFYIVIFDNLSNTFAFKFSATRSITPKDYSYNKSKSFNALKVFNSVIYVIKECLKKYNPPSFQFSGAESKEDSSLVGFYDKIVNNKQVLDILDSVGYKYSGLTNKKTHVFKKKLTSYFGFKK